MIETKNRKNFFIYILVRRMKLGSFQPDITKKVKNEKWKVKATKKERKQILDIKKSRNKRSLRIKESNAKNIKESIKKINSKAILRAKQDKIN